MVLMHEEPQNLCLASSCSSTVLLYNMRRAYGAAVSQSSKAVFQLSLILGENV